jgi:hypothetical protein
MPIVLMPYVGPPNRYAQARADVSAMRAGSTWDEIEVALRRLGWEQEAYWQDLYYWWRFALTIVVIEQDVLVNRNTIRLLLECPHDWCSWLVPYQNGFHAGMSCVKFSGALVARNPDAFDKVAAISDDRHPAKHWCALDQRLSDTLIAAGEQKHIHEPPLRHLDPWPSHDTCRGFALPA